MKRMLLMSLALSLMVSGFAQDEKNEKKDTIRIGGITIIRTPGNDNNSESKQRNITIPRRNTNRMENVSTNWWILDLGFSNFTDNTNYSSVATQAFAPGSTDDWFKVRGGKSRNVNLWFFMQRLNVVKHVVNLKYGMGLELNNYHFEEDIVFNKKPTSVTMNSTEFKKNKLAADYLTVPMMLNFNFTPQRRNGFGISGGVSAGYLYSARHKTIDGNDKNKVRSDFDLKRWKLSYVGELLLGPVKLYGSYAFDNMWDKGLDQTPYTVGFRLSNW